MSPLGEVEGASVVNKQLFSAALGRTSCQPFPLFLSVSYRLLKRCRHTFAIVDSFQVLTCQQGVPWDISSVKYRLVTLLFAELSNQKWMSDRDGFIYVFSPKGTACDPCPVWTERLSVRSCSLHC